MNIPSFLKTFGVALSDHVVWGATKYQIISTKKKKITCGLKSLFLYISSKKFLSN